MDQDCSHPLKRDTAANPRFILVDRDGTINVDVHYLSDPKDLRFETNAIDGLKNLSVQGFQIAIITNQSGVGRGLFSMARLDEIHARLSAMLAAQGIVVKGYFCCPHRPDEDCDCRKPKTGLVRQAQAALGFDPKQAWVIGDKATDIALGRTVGSYAALVRTGEGRKAQHSCTPDVIADDLLDAAEKIKAFEGRVQDRDGEELSLSSFKQKSR